MGFLFILLPGLNFVTSVFVYSFGTSLVAQTVKCLYNVGDPGSIHGLGRSPGEGNGNPLQYSCLENHTDRGAWWATVHWVAELDTTERLHLHFVSDLSDAPASSLLIAALFIMPSCQEDRDWRRHGHGGGSCEEGGMCGWRPVILWVMMAFVSLATMGAQL